MQFNSPSNDRPNGKTWHPSHFAGIIQITKTSRFPLLSEQLWNIFVLCTIVDGSITKTPDRENSFRSVAYLICTFGCAQNLQIKCIQ